VFENEKRANQYAKLQEGSVLPILPEFLCAGIKELPCWGKVKVGKGKMHYYDPNPPVGSGRIGVLFPTQTYAKHQFQAFK
jgi:hypothetical protein